MVHLRLLHASSDLQDIRVMRKISRKVKNTNLLRRKPCSLLRFVEYTQVEATRDTRPFPRHGGLLTTLRFHPEHEINVHSQTDPQSEGG